MTTSQLMCSPLFGFSAECNMMRPPSSTQEYQRGVDNPQKPECDCHGFTVIILRQYCPLSSCHTARHWQSKLRRFNIWTVCVTWSASPSSSASEEGGRSNLLRIPAFSSATSAAARPFTATLPTAYNACRDRTWSFDSDSWRVCFVGSRQCWASVAGAGVAGVKAARRSCPHPCRASPAGLRPGA